MGQNAKTGSNRFKAALLADCLYQPLALRQHRFFQGVAWPHGVQGLGVGKGRLRTTAKGLRVLGQLPGQIRGKTWQRSLSQLQIEAHRVQWARQQAHGQGEGQHNVILPDSSWVAKGLGTIKAGETMGQILWQQAVGGGQLMVVRGDITEEPVDAIVNAANSQLAHGGGVAGAIVRKGGRVIQEESSRLAPVPVGGAVVTSAGALPCRWVIHAVGPVWGEGDEENKLRSAVRQALMRAEELRAEKVALPAISTGIFGYPKAAGCRVIVSECGKFLQGASHLLEVRLVAWDEETAQHFLRACRELLP